MTDMNSLARNKDLFSQINCLTKIVTLNPITNHIFMEAPDLKLTDYYIGAGCIAQSIWNYVCGLPVNYGIHDIDFVYFDSDLSYDKECEVIDMVNQRFGDLPIRLDIKNQSRVHLWYENHFGYPIDPYSSLEEAINTWPTTATAIGMRKDENGEWSIYAPFGLNDLFSLIVRANKAQITKEIYEGKVDRWKGKWPALTIIPWD